jgi:hypothetical protein
MHADSVSSTPRVFTLEQVAGPQLPCNVRWLADRLRSGEFVGHKIGRTWVLTEEDILENIRRCAVRPKAVSTIYTTDGNLPQSTSMTRTTARRMRRGGDGGA